jgi:hypothetical protein
MTTAIGLVVRSALEGLQVAQRVVADQHDRPTASAVAAVGTASRNVRLAAERHAAVSAAPGLDQDARLVVEHQLPSVICSDCVGMAPEDGAVWKLRAFSPSTFLEF